MNRPTRLADDALRTVLRAGDPAAGEGGLDPTELATIRLELDRAVARRPTLAPFRWAAAGALLGLGALVTLLLRPVPVGPAGRPGTPHVTTRQLDFRTPGGTRLIWVFDAPASKEMP